MSKEACRLTLTVALFGIICMAKGLSTRKESSIIKNINNNNNDLIYRKEFHGDKGLDYKNEYFRKKKYAEQEGDVKESNLQRVYDKGNIVSKNNNAIPEEQLNENNGGKYIDKSEYTSKIVKKRMNDLSHFKQGRKYPLSYLHINHDKKYKQPELYILNANDFNEDVIRRLTRIEKKYELPICDINEDQQNIHASRSILKKRGLSNNNKKQKMNLNNNLIRKVRSQWRFRGHYNNNNKFNFPAGYTNKQPMTALNKREVECFQNDLDNDDKANIVSETDEQKGFSSQINYDNNNSNNLTIKCETIDKEEEMSTIELSNKQKTQLRRKNNRKKQNELCNKSKAGIINNSNNISYNADPMISNETRNINDNVSSSVNNASDQVQMVQNQELLDQKYMNLANQSQVTPMLNINEDKNYLNLALVQSNNTNDSLELNKKNKIQISNVQAPLLHPITLGNGAVPNISYIYLQPFPFANPMFLPKYPESSPSSINAKKVESVANVDTKSNDLITIAIDPKTLQNKILHAEFIKKSEVKKTPDTLSIELAPKDTISTNTSKNQKTVSAVKPLKISASVKNNSIFITGGDAKALSAKLSNGKYNQQYQSFEEPEIEKESLNGQMKSISSSININGFLDDDGRSLNEYDSQNKINFKDKLKTDEETKVLIINSKQKEFCQTDVPCKQHNTVCSIDICGNDSPCKLSTWDLQNFKELHEGSIEETHPSSLIANISGTEDSTMAINPSSKADISTPNPKFVGAKIKRETEQMNMSKIIDLLKPVVVLSPKTDDEGSEDGSGDTVGIIDKVNLKGSEMTFEKGNKKVENKILEGFINSIIANYSKDEIKPLMKETTEKTEDGAEALLKLLENSMPKRNERDKEYVDEKKEDVWNLTPILVPESRISKYGDSSEYAKLGPFDENFIKSFLRKDSVSSLYGKNK